MRRWRMSLRLTLRGTIGMRILRLRAGGPESEGKHRREYYAELAATSHDGCWFPFLATRSHLKNDYIFRCD